MPEYADLLYEVDSNVATIPLNRPDRLNAISGPMLASFSQAFRDADLDPAVRVIILTGAGRGFCAGLDLKDLPAGTGLGANEGGGTGLLPRLIGWPKAAEITFRGVTLGADECLELGLVNKVVAHDDLMAESRKMAGAVAATA